MKNLLHTSSVYEFLITNGWSPDAIPQWVARPEAVRQMEQAQADQKQVVADQAQPQQPQVGVVAGGPQVIPGKTLPIEGVPGGRVQTGPQQPQGQVAGPGSGVAGPGSGVAGPDKYQDMSTEELSALGLVRTADNQYYRINQLPSGRVIIDPDDRHAQVLYVRMMGMGANSEDNGVSLY